MSIKVLANLSSIASYYNFLQLPVRPLQINFHIVTITLPFSFNLRNKIYEIVFVPFSNKTYSFNNAVAFFFLFLCATQGFIFFMLSSNKLPLI